MASLDMSLDDMIRNRRNSQRGRRQARRGRGAAGSYRGGRPADRGGRPAGAPRRTQLGVNAQSSAFRIAKSFRRVRNLPWHDGLFEDGLKAAGVTGLDAGTKLHVSNLDVGVTNEDIRELFSEIGELIRYAVHYDKNGRPSGSAEVLFARRSDAFQALKRYSNVQLDGKPMKLEIVGDNIEVPVLARVNVVRGANGPQRTVVMRSGRGRGRVGPTNINRGPGRRGGGNLRGGRGGGRGRGRGGNRGRGRKNRVERSADDLDKELETYHSAAMQS